MNNLKSYDRAVLFHCTLVVAEILNRENVRWKWRKVAVKSEIVLCSAMYIYLRGNGVFGPELYFRSRHQLRCIMAMDTRIHFGTGEKPSFWDTSCTVYRDIRTEIYPCSTLSTFMVNKVSLRRGFHGELRFPLAITVTQISFSYHRHSGTNTDNVAM